jgi:hypothetical protein
MAQNNVHLPTTFNWVLVLTVRLALPPTNEKCCEEVKNVLT